MRVWHWIAERVDLRDAHFYGGLFLSALGGWKLSPAWTLVIVGGLLTAYSVLLPWLTPRGRT
jgi:hypothetical protein